MPQFKCGVTSNKRLTVLNKIGEFAPHFIWSPQYVFWFLLSNFNGCLLLSVVKEIKMRKIIVFLLSLTIAITPTFVFASGGFAP